MGTAERGPAQGDALAVRRRLLTLPERLRPEAVDGFAAEFGLRIGSDPYRLTIEHGRCAVLEEDPIGPAARIATDPRTWLALDAGTLSSIDAFLAGRIEVRGHIDYAVRMPTLFRYARRERRSQDLEHVAIPVEDQVLSAFALGEGPPVVMLHGLAATKLSYLPLVSAVAERYRVIVPDLPGHGESPKPRASYTPSYYARVVLGLLDAVGAPRATIVGNSMGGRIALEVAARAPDRVSSLVLLDPAAAGLPFPFFVRFLRLLPPRMGAVPLPFRRRVVVAAIRQLFAQPDRLPSQAYGAGADEFVRVYRSARARVALLSAIRGLVVDDPATFWARAEEVTAPTLIVWGREDRLVPVRFGRRLARTMPRAELVVLPGVGHVSQFEVPGVTCDLILGFLEGLERAA